jgi:hypothetical protein
VPYWELSASGGPNCDAGVEIGRIDYTGDANYFEPEYLFDPRKKIYGGWSIAPLTSIGGSFAWGQEPKTGDYIFETAVSLSFGVSLWEPLTLGLNLGKKAQY